jgi:hypothetical protein
MSEIMDLDTKLQRAPNVIATDMDGETVMMHIERGAYFGLTGSGSQVWAALETPSTLRDVIGFIEEQFDVSEVDDLAGVMTQFVGQLVEQGLVDRAN